MLVALEDNHSRLSLGVQQLQPHQCEDGQAVNSEKEEVTQVLEFFNDTISQLHQPLLSRDAVVAFQNYHLYDVFAKFVLEKSLQGSARERKATVRDIASGAQIHCLLDITTIMDDELCERSKGLALVLEATEVRTGFLWNECVEEVSALFVCVSQFALLVFPFLFCCLATHRRGRVRRVLTGKRQVARHQAEHPSRIRKSQ